MNNKLVGLNEFGRLVGESHQNAVLSDREVELMRRLHEEDGWGYRRLAKKFEIGKTTVRRICNYEKRAQTVARWKRCP